MNFNYPLTSDDYTALRQANYAGSQYCSQLPNTVVFAAQLNGSVSDASFAENTWHNATVGAYGDALVGQLLLISHVNDMTLAYFTGRVRQSFDATNIYFNETSLNQTSGDYFWVIDDYPVMDKLIEYDTTNNEYLVDWADTYHTLRPIVCSADDSTGLKSAYANFVDDTSELYRISLSAKFEVGPSSGTITAWSLDIIDGTLISGSLSGSGSTTGVIVVDFPAGFRHILLSATNSAGQSSTLAIKVWAETRTGSATLVAGHNGAQITKDVTNPGILQTCSLEIFSDELQSTLPNTPLCIWDEEYLGGALGSIGNNIRFVGRLRKEANQAKADPKYVRTLSTRWTLEGADTQLNRLENFKTFRITNSDSAAAWGQIDGLTPYNALWLLLSEFTTFSNSNVINFDDYAATFPYPGMAVQGSTILSIVNDLAMSVNAQMMFSGDGRALIARHAFYLTADERDALSVVADFGDSDRTADLTYSTDDIRNIAQVDAWGGEWSGGTNVTPLHSMAAGIARDIGERSLVLNKQILDSASSDDAQTQLSNRAGCHWVKEAYANRLSGQHTPGYGFLIPDVSAWYTWTVSADDNLRNYSFDTSTRWILEKVTESHDNRTGSKKVDPVYRQETNGNGLGKAIAIPDPSGNMLSPNFAINTGFFSAPLVTPPITPIGMAVRQMAKGLKKYAVPCSDGTRKLTNDFDKLIAGEAPHWTSASMGVSGTPLLWVPDAFSTRFSSSTGKTYGWLITTTKIYYGELNTPSFTLYYTFRSASSLRSADASIRQVGHIAVVSDYSDGTYATYATTGGNFVSEYSVGAGNGSYPPGCAYSSHINNQVFASINGTGKKSTDGGASYSTYAGIDPGGDCATEIAIPYISNVLDKILYYCKVGTQTRIITFDAGGYAYTIMQGTITTGGNPNNCLYDTDVAGGSCNAKVKMSFTSPVTVTAGQLDYKKNHTGNCGRQLRLYDSGDNLLYDSGSILSTPTNNTWFTETFSTGTVADVSYAVFENGAGGGIDTMNVYLDNCQLTLSSQNHIIRLEADGTTQTDVTPVVGFAPWQSRGQIAVSPTNPNIVAVVAGNSGLTQTSVYVSNNAGKTWSAISGPDNNPYTRVFFSSDKKNILYLVGNNGAIGYCADLRTIISKTGNLSTVATALGIAAL